MLSALYKDDEILVLDKPSGLPSQPGEGVRVSVVEAVERDFGFRPFLVHRLDKETAGCLIVARSSAAAAKWSRLVESRELGKTYRAIVSGAPTGGRGSFNDPVATRGEEKSAATAWRLLGSFGAAAPAAPRFSCLELELGTGRTHQIRIHLAGHGLPILGDDRHGDFALNKLLRKELGLRRLLLVAWSLVLPGGQLVRASLPEHFAAFLSRFPDAPSLGQPASPGSYSLLHGASWLRPDGGILPIAGFHEEWLREHEDLAGGSRNVCELILRKRWISVSLFDGGYVELMVPESGSEEVRRSIYELLSRNSGSWEKALVMSMDREGYSFVDPADLSSDAALAAALARAV